MISPRPRSMPSSTRTGAPSPDPAAHWTRYLERADAGGAARARFWLAKAALAAGDNATANAHLRAAAAAAPWGYYGLRAAALLAGTPPLTLTDGSPDVPVADRPAARAGGYPRARPRGGRADARGRPRRRPAHRGAPGRAPRAATPRLPRRVPGPGDGGREGERLPTAAPAGADPPGG